MVLFNSAVEFLLRCYSLCKTMYRKAKPFNRYQCCQQGVAFTDFECSSNFFGNHNTPPAALPSLPSCFPISISFANAGTRIPTGASALGMTWKYDRRSNSHRHCEPVRTLAWQSVPLQYFYKLCGWYRSTRENILLPLLFRRVR